ncbi:PAS/PAC sensor signal transduction histidine kinase [Salinarchaeum sp. Harcht-Bsk1]|nr:PAS/PAC sensor signal transduction histidine kinase [Salinarchaeum sp. Harcht-Bsk1]
MAADGAAARSIQAVLEASLSGYRIANADSIAAATDGLDEAVSCVVTPGTLPDGSGVDLAARIADRERSPPVVLVPREIDETVALATTDGVAAIVPAEHEDRLAAAVDDVASSYLERFGKELQLEAVETMFGAIEDVFQIKDADGRYLRLLSNREWPSESDALGRTDRVLHDDQFGVNETYYAEDQQVLDSGDPILGEVTAYGDGPLFWLETTKVPLRDDDGTVRGLVGHVRDVSDRMQDRSELERKNQRLDRFAGYVTHDLQNPLSIATGYLELAKEGDEEALAAVEDAIERMQQLIDDIEILARGEQRMLQTGDDGTLVAAQQHVVEIVRNVWSVLAPETATLEIDLPEGTVLYAGEQEFRSMLENLLKNALQHGGEDVTVRIGRVYGGMYVEDDGPGVPVDERDEIFEQGYSTAKGGTGTGLAIVDEVATAHEWDLEVETGTDGGARFVIGNCLLITDRDHIAAPSESIELTERADVGEPGTPGRSHFDPDDETWTIESAGEDIWGWENDFHFVHATCSGDVRIEARLRDALDRNEFSKTGIMVRDDLAEDSALGYVGLTRDTLEVLWCSEAGERTRSQQIGDTEGRYDWLRLDREGDLLTAFVSADGAEWFPIDQRRVALGETVHAGLAVCSAVHRDSCTATFSDVTVHRLTSE